MDPRYHHKKDVALCKFIQSIDLLAYLDLLAYNISISWLITSLGQCIEKMSAMLGDPSTWSHCDCPPPCLDAIYTVEWSEASFVQNVSFAHLT